MPLRWVLSTVEVINETYRVSPRSPIETDLAQTVLSFGE